MRDALILVLMLVLAFVGFHTSPQPEAAIQDTTIFHRAQLGIPDNARPILQRCYPVDSSSHDAVAAIGLEQEPVT